MKIPDTARPGDASLCGSMAETVYGTAMADGRDSTADNTDAAAFTVVAPATPGRFVFASPHSGDRYPADMGAAPGLAAASVLSAVESRPSAMAVP